MHRIFTPHSDFSTNSISITDKGELHHLKDVLRLKNGTTLELFNGQGEEAVGKILSISSKNAELKISNYKESEMQYFHLILACAMPKKSKFETIIEKATELGIDEIIPLETKRTEVKIKADQMKKKLKRFETVAINACKQSKRAHLPVIHPITRFPDALAHLKQRSAVVIPSLTGKTKPLIESLLKLKANDQKSISFLIGPEGDFTPDEYKIAFKEGCLPVTLGPTTLKVETAALCVSSTANLIFK